MEPQYHSNSNGGYHGSQDDYYYYEDEDDFSAEEIFNIFFGYSGTRLNKLLISISLSLVEFHRINNSLTSTSSTNKSVSLQYTFCTQSNTKCSFFIFNFDLLIILNWIDYLDHSYACPIVALFISIFHFNNRHISCKRTAISITSNWVSKFVGL